MNPLTKWPLWLQIILAVALCSVLVASFLGRYVRQQETEYLQERMRVQSREATALLSAASVEAVVRLDRLGLETVVEESGRVLSGLRRLAVHGREGDELAVWRRSDDERGESFVTRTPIRVSTETFGSTVATWDMAEARANIDRHARRLEIATLIGIMAMGLLIAALTHLLTSRPIRVIDQGLSELSQGRLSSPVSVAAAPELGRLADSVNSLDSALQERDAREGELRTSQSALARTNEQLRTEARERKRAERAVRRQNRDLVRSNRSLEEFAYAASHDLQEPLRKIQAFSSRLVSEYNESLDERGLDYLSRAHSAATRARRLIEDLLALARVSRAGAKFEPVDLNDAVETATSELSEHAQNSHARIEVSALPTVSGIPSQLVQLFINLIENGIKFRRDGVDPHIEVSARTFEEEGGSWWEIKVKDNGIGFKEKYAKQIFAMFGRLHGRDKYEGTGIGLTICERIVHAHGGEIRAKGQESESDGATFLIQLPQMEGDGTNAPVHRGDSLDLDDED